MWESAACKSSQVGTCYPVYMGHMEPATGEAKRGGGTVAFEVRLARKIQLLVLRGLSDRSHLIFYFGLSALRAVLSFSGPRRGDLLTALGCDVHCHTAMAVHRAGAARRPPLTGRAGSRDNSP